MKVFGVTIVTYSVCISIFIERAGTHYPHAGINKYVTNIS